MKTNQNKVAIVTGSSRGIGAAVAKRLALDGFSVVVNYAGRAADAEKIVQEIRTAGGQAIAVKADVSTPAEIAILFDKAEEAFGGVDVIVNNAGIMQPGLVPLADTDDALFDRLFSINVKGTFNALRLAARRLRTGGRIVNFSTSVVGLALPGYAAYAATKSAVETLTNIFAKELRGREISVNAIAPGPTATDLFIEGKTPEQMAHLAKMAPLERLGQPQDIAGAVSFLVGPDGGWVNGQTLRVNGGIV
jgi:3-oxoacyl-[acyl-carrier protein] reductase